MNPSDAILDIQREYLRLLELHFEKERAELAQLAARDENFVYDEAFIRESILPRGTSVTVPYRGHYLSPTEYRLFSLFDDIDSFWDSKAEQLAGHLEDCGLQQLYVACEPKDVPDLVRRYGVYFDTLCVPCPFYSYRETLEEALHGDRRAENVGFISARYFALHHVMQTFLFRTYPPPFVVVPSKHLLRPGQVQSIYRTRDQGGDSKAQPVADRCYFHCARLFEEVFERDFDFGSIEEAGHFISLLHPDQLHPDNTARFAKLVDVDYRIAALDLEWTYYGRWDDEVYADLKGLAKGEPGGTVSSTKTVMHLWNSFVWELLATSTIYLDSCSLGVDPYFFPQYWELYRWQLSNESEAIRRSLNLSENEVAAYTLSVELQWLSELPMDAVIAIRNDEGLSTVRELFRKNRNRLGAVKADEIERVAAEVAKEFEKAVLDFHSLCAERKKQLWKRLAAGGTSLFTTCGLGVASVVVPVALPLAIVSSIYSAVLGGKSIRALYEEYRQGTSSLRGMKRSPVGVLARFYPEAPA